jgi:peroxiredoxin
MLASFRASPVRAPLLATLVLGLCGAAAAQQTPAADKPAAGKPAAEKPAATEPKTAKVGEAAPDFTLKDIDGKEHALADLTKAGKIVVLEWFNPDCPVSRGYHAPDDVMNKAAEELAGKDVAWLAINSGAAGTQGAGLERNRKAAEEFGLSYPVLLDDTGKVGQLYAAKTTPHMFVIGKDGKLAYAGAIDDGGPQARGKTNYVREAVTALLAGKDVAVKETRAFGCSVKYAD